MFALICADHIRKIVYNCFCCHIPSNNLDATVLLLCIPITRQRMYVRTYAGNCSVTQEPLEVERQNECQKVCNCPDHAVGRLDFLLV